MLNEDYSRLVIAEREHEFRRRARLRRDQVAALFAPAESVVLRLCRVEDDPELELLAELDGAELVAGRYVLAEVGGRIVAALPLAGGDVVADPFHATDQVLPLLRLRAAQLTRPARPRSLVTWLRPSPVRH